ncbi:MAG: single-stranded DNA-binding protein [Candidatus Margulisiibacteriota bacterium]
MYNKAFLIGNLTRDPELRYTPSGIPVARFTVAVNRVRRKGTEGNNNEVDFINVVAWRRLAEICGEFLKKGRAVAVEGRLQIRTFTGKDGQSRTVAEVVADNMQMLGTKGIKQEFDQVEQAVPGVESEPYDVQPEVALEEEVPF